MLLSLRRPGPVHRCTLLPSLRSNPCVSPLHHCLTRIQCQGIQAIITIQRSTPVQQAWTSTTKLPQYGESTAHKNAQHIEYSIILHPLSLLPLVLQIGVMRTKRCAASTTARQMVGSSARAGGPAFTTRAAFARGPKSARMGQMKSQATVT